MSQMQTGTDVFNQPAKAPTTTSHDPFAPQQPKSVIPDPFAQPKKAAAPVDPFATLGQTTQQKQAGMDLQNAAVSFATNMANPFAQAAPKAQPVDPFAQKPAQSDPFATSFTPQPQTAPVDNPFGPSATATNQMQHDPFASMSAPVQPKKHLAPKAMNANANADPFAMAFGNQI